MYKTRDRKRNATGAYTELTSEGSSEFTRSDREHLCSPYWKIRGGREGGEEKRRKEYDEHLGRSLETLFLGVNLASCDPLSAELAGSQLGPLEPPWPFCLEPGNVSGVQGWGNQTWVCRRDWLRQRPCRGKGVYSPHAFGSPPLGLVGWQGSFPPLWGQLGTGWGKVRGQGSRRKGRLPVPRPEMPEQIG